MLIYYSTDWSSLFSSNYARYIKSYGSIKTRDYSGAVIAEIMRSIYSKEWNEVTESPNKVNSKVVEILNNDGICKLPINNNFKIGLIKEIEINKVSNNSKERTYVVPCQTYARSIYKLLINQDILKLVSTYLQAPARIQSWQVTWNNVGANPDPMNGQLYHRDRDDFRSLRLYMYLNDVADKNGPHFYIKGSHNWKNLINLNTNKAIRPCIDDSDHCFMSDEKVFKGNEYSKQKEVSITGKSGYCWLEDGGGLHKGSVPLTKGDSRFMLAITWGLFDGQQYINGGGHKQIRDLQKKIIDERKTLSCLQKYAISIK